MNYELFLSSSFQDPKGPNFVVYHENIYSLREIIGGEVYSATNI
jgi:hypothetical protein